MFCRFLGIGGQYGRGRTIDTSRTYRISHGQVMDGDYLARSFHHLEQDGKTASFDACGNYDYMKWMGYDLHDIVAVFSLWDMGCDEQWLDGCTGKELSSVFRSNKRVNCFKDLLWGKDFVANFVLCNNPIL